MEKSFEARRSGMEEWWQKRMVFVSGPISSSKGLCGVYANINAAWEVAQQFWRMGYAVFCPHTNSFMMDGVDFPDGNFYNGDLYILSKCDYIHMLPGWENSKGAKMERKFARARGIPQIHLDGSVSMLDGEEE